MPEIMCATCGATDGHYPWCAVGQLNADVAELTEAVAAKDRRIAELGEQLEHDRTLVCDCLRLTREALHAYSWLLDGRGSYEWDDDQWKIEFRDAVAAIKAAIAPMVKVAADWRGCPQTGAEIIAARVKLKAPHRGAGGGAAITAWMPKERHR